MRALLYGLAVAAILGLSAGAAKAQTLDFAGQENNVDAITIGATDITGTDISIESLLVVGTASMDGTYVITGYCISTENATAGCLDFDTATGALSITGTIAALGVYDATLLTGTITSFSVVDTTVSFVIVLSGSDTKDAEMLRALGIDPNQNFAFGGVTIAVSCDAAGVCDAISTDIPNVAVVEPGTLGLFGIGLVGLAFAMRRRRRAAIA